MHKGNGVMIKVFISITDRSKGIAWLYVLYFTMKYAFVMPVTPKTKGWIKGLLSKGLVESMASLRCMVHVNNKMAIKYPTQNLL